MRYRKLDENGDYVFGEGSVDMLVDIDAVAQAIKTKLLLLLGEWWENVEEGVPYFQSVFTQRSNENGKLAVDTVLRERILTTPGVTQIVSYDGEFTDRHSYSVNFTVLSVYSEINMSLEVEV